MVDGAFSSVAPIAAALPLSTSSLDDSLTNPRSAVEDGSGSAATDALAFFSFPSTLVFVLVGVLFPSTLLFAFVSVTESEADVSDATEGDLIFLSKGIATFFFFPSTTAFVVSTVATEVVSRIACEFDDGDATKGDLILSEIVASFFLFPSTLLFVLVSVSTVGAGDPIEGDLIFLSDAVEGDFGDASERGLSLESKLWTGDEHGEAMFNFRARAAVSDLAAAIFDSIDRMDEVDMGEVASNDFLNAGTAATASETALFVGLMVFCLAAAAIAIAFSTASFVSFARLVVSTVRFTLVFMLDTFGLFASASLILLASLFSSPLSVSSIFVQDWLGSCRLACESVS
ncbi:hypothetical protein ACHAXH_005559 [Discostella pseudostelligera]